MKMPTSAQSEQQQTRQAERFFSAEKMLQKLSVTKKQQKPFVNIVKGCLKWTPPQRAEYKKMKFISEGDLYRLITHSKLPSAEKFERWVFDEVLPTIHKHGVYMTEQTIEKALASPDFLIQLATQLKTAQEQRKQLELVTKVQKQQIAELQPKADYCDSILSCQGVMPINIIAKDYGKSAIWLNQHLHAKGVQYSMDGVWVLYQKYANKGYTVTKTVPYTNPYTGLKEFNVHTYWTQKGRLFIYDLLKADGILPLIERNDSDES